MTTGVDAETLEMMLSAAKLLREGLRLDVRALVVSVPDAASPAGGIVPADDRFVGWAPVYVSVAEPGRTRPASLQGWWATTDGFVVTVLTAPATPRPSPLPAGG